MIENLTVQSFWIAITEYRARRGNFRSIEDLKKVPGIDPEKIDARKDISEF